MSFKILSVGDFMTGENLHHFRRGIPHKYKDNFSCLVTPEAREIIHGCDLFFLNFESSLAPYSQLLKLPIEKAAYVAPLEVIELLNSFQVPIIANIANNHFGQHSSKLAEYSVQQLIMNNITVVGMNNQPVSLTKDNTIINIWGVSLIESKNESSHYFKCSYNELIESLQLKPKNKNEFRIISIHWGTEYHTIPSTKQRELAIALASSGFDLILGHHPHTIQQVEKLNNTWVVYSHGNFIFDQNFSSITQKGLVVKFTFPEKDARLYLSQQKHYKVVKLKEINVEDLNRFCLKNFSKWKPLQIRIQMKVELLIHFYEINISIIKLFSFKLLKSLGI